MNIPEIIIAYPDGSTIVHDLHVGKAFDLDGRQALVPVRRVRYNR